MAYGTSAAERVLAKNEHLLRKQTEKLQAQLTFFEYTRAELYQEVLLLFFKNFEDYYEEDGQYLRFLFIATKNKIINIKKQRAVWANRFKNEVAVANPEEEFAGQNAIEHSADIKSVSTHLDTEQILGLFKSRKLRNIVCELMKSRGKELAEFKRRMKPRHMEIIRSVVEKHILDRSVS